MCFWLPAISASTLRLAGSVTAMADHSCMLELVAADWAAAIRVSRVPDGTGSDRKPRTERWSSRVAMVSFHGPAGGMAAP